MSRLGQAAQALRRTAGAHRAVAGARLGELHLMLAGRRLAPAPVADSVDAVARVVDVAEPSHLWAALAVLRAELPTVEEVTAARRRAELDGAGAVLAAIVRDAPLHTAHRTVQAVVDATVVDLGDMLTSTLGTGIQRVARNVAAAWDAVHPMVVAGWTDDFGALRAATPAERSTALTGARAGSPPGPARPREHARRADTVLVPWRSTYLLPELAIQPRRCAAIQGLAQLSGNSTGVIGFDCVPITSSETSAGGFPDAFARNLAAVAHFDVVAAISGAAAGEYRGWARMLEGAGLTGPRVVEVPLPAQAPEPSAADLAAARARLTVPGLDMVLVVGSHEPRKNHLAVLHAAETAWRRGHRFSLVFVGGNAWGSEEFVGRLESLRSAGHPFESVSKMPDSQLWAAYRLARFTAFPSLNEGFGLPVAESLSAGTPVLTSNYGSMRQLADEGGAVVVDPRDDADLAQAFERLLIDDELITRLAAEAAARPVRTWRDYAEETWAAMPTTRAGAAG